MLTFEAFTGINNVLPAHRLQGSDLLEATDVNIGLTGEITRRGGLTLESGECHKNLHQANGFMLATCGSVLTAIHPGGARHAIHPAMGPERVCCCDLPDGRTTYTNGLIHGVTDGFVGVVRSVAAKGMEWEGWRARLSAATARVESAARQSSIVVDGYRAGASAAEAQAGAYMRRWEADIKQYEAGQSITYQVAKMNTDAVLHTNDARMDAAKVGFTASSQRLASAWAMVSASAQISGQASMQVIQQI